MTAETQFGSQQLASLSPEHEAPVGNDRGFSFTPNPAFDMYLKMDKGFVEGQGVRQLEDIYRSLATEEMPRYLIAGGWAAAEVALVQSDKSIDRRLETLHQGADCWTRAITNQLKLNTSGPEGVAEYSVPYRIALNLAVMPLLEGIVCGDMTMPRRRLAFRNCLEVAQANAEQMGRYKKSNGLRFADHAGFSHELKALLAFNRQLSASWFMLPSMSRADSGHYHREQTHDLLVVHQKWGEIKSVLPVEVKDRGRSKDKKRYKALMIFADPQLTPQAEGRTVNLLDVLSAERTGRATELEIDAVANVTEGLVDMVRGYYSGKILSNLAMHSVTSFHDGSKLFAEKVA